MKNNNFNNNNQKCNNYNNKNCCNKNNFNNKFNLNSLYEIENFLCTLKNTCKCINFYKFFK